MGLSLRAFAFLAGWAVGAAALPAGAAAQEVAFEVTAIPNAGRSVAARIADFDGDGRADLMIVSVEGMPPYETRSVRVFLQQPGRELSLEPNHVVALPSHSGVYDLADLLPWPGVELVLLRPSGVTLLSLADASGRSRELPVADGGSVATAEDERGFEPFPLVYRDFGPEPWILVPQFGRLVALTADAKVRASLTVGRRSNYVVVPNQSLVSAESDMQLFIDVPKIAVGDVDGDGSSDIVSATRHEIRVFLRHDDGGFESAPSRTLPLGFMSRRDHIRGSGGVTCEFRDFDGDGRLDLLISHVEGSITDATTTTYVFQNRQGSWQLDAPDAIFRSDGALASNTLVDTDRDGRPEMLRFRVKFSLLELVELLLTREVDAEITLHRQAEAGFEQRPVLERSLGIPFSFDTFRARGFLPTFEADLDADGRADLLTSAGGDAIEVYLGAGKEPFARRSARQRMSTAGVIDFADFSGDGLTDFVLFDPHNFDADVQLAVNTGLLEMKTKGKRSRRHREVSISSVPEAEPAPSPSDDLSSEPSSSEPSSR